MALETEEKEIINSTALATIKSNRIKAQIVKHIAEEKICIK